jgi:ligand-binding sensor domain-containing protein/signal transduction histidine kinase
MRNKFACWLIFLLLTTHAKAQQFTFNRVPLFDENVQGFITGIAQDSKGYIWFTGTSLYRYDGYHVVTYKHDPLNPQSLSPSRLECIYIDREGIIWLGTVSAGLDRFDPATGIFTHYQNDSNDSLSLSNNIVTAILEDTDGHLWVATHGGLDLLNRKSGKFTHFQKKLNDSTSLSNNEVRALYQDRNGTIWVGCGSPYNNETPEGEGGLNRMDTKTGKFTRYFHDPKNPNTLLDNKVRAIYEDSRGNFWVGTFGDGLHLMDREKGTFRRLRYNPSHPEQLSAPWEKTNFYGMSFITEDKAGGIWIGAFLAGLNYYDPKTSQVIRFKPEVDNIKALGENSVWAATFSREGELWITTQANVYRVDPLRKNIPHHRTGGRVHSFYEDASGILWIASDSGFIKNDRKNNLIKYFLNNQNDPGTINSNIVLSIYEDRKGSLWVGTDRGLNLFDKRTEKFIRFEHDNKNIHSIGRSGILSFVEDGHGVFWIATGEGLDIMNRERGSFKHYTHNPSDSNSLSSNNVFKIFEDRSGNLWVGTWGGGGLNLFERETGKFKHYLVRSSVNEIFQGSNGTLWVGTQAGLYKKDVASNDFVLFTDPASEIGAANIMGIAEDKQKKLWVGSQSAIIKLDLATNQTSIYGRKYGVYPNSIYDLNVYRNSDGELFFGDGTGYFQFFPQFVYENATSPQLQITDFKIQDVSVLESKGYLPKPFEQSAIIKLKYNENIFSIDFAGMHYSSLEENRHLFMLENYDKKWRKAGSEKIANYFNVPPGKYIFKIKASGSDGTWSEKNLTIIITPPWWFTWWAYALYAIIIFGAIWAIIYYRSRHLIKEKKLLWDKVKIRTEQVLKQKEEIAKQRDNLKTTLEELKATQAQLIQREKMASLGELTAGVAHEIQNPLNFVNNFSEVNAELVDDLYNELNEGNKDEVIAIAKNIKDNLQKIAYHGSRADAIVKGMLQHSRKNTGQLESIDINALADEYFRLSYHGLRAKDKSFNAIMKTDYDNSIGKINVVPQDMGRVFLNLYNNAFYSVTEKNSSLHQTGLEAKQYEPTVSVSTKLVKSPSGDSDKIEISVKDNGMGIPKSMLDKIYQPFFTTKPSGRGTGLGLSLSYDIIKAHGGEIKVNTKEDEGTEFIIHLPII